MNIDIVNSLFGLCGAYFAWLNVLKLWKDKKVQGVSYVSFVFWIAWGIWNLFYFYNLGHIFSFIIGILMLTANVAWVILALMLRRK